MPRRAPKLVTQYLENIRRRALEEHPDLVRRFVGHRTGIYALFRHDELYYAGLATDLRWRLKHLRQWSLISIRETPRGMLVRFHRLLRPLIHQRTMYASGPKGARDSGAAT